MQSLGAVFHRCSPFTLQGASGLAAIMLVVLGVSHTSPARGADASTNALADPVLSLMLEKGMITEDEATKVQAQVDARRAGMDAQLPPSKWIMSPGIKNMEVFGDIRLRYEDREATDPGGFRNPNTAPHHGKYLPPGYIDLARLRYSLRFGLRGEALDDFYYGFRLETSSNPRSSWVTMGTSSSGNPYQGPFGKSTSGINIGQIYLGWRPESWVDISLGKMPNPLYTTTMVWSPSINPEGAAEHFKYTIGPVDLFATFGQFLYADSNPNSSSAGYFNLINTDASTGDMPFLLAWQGGVTFHLTKKMDFKVAPTLYTYSRFNYGKSPKNDTSGYTPDFSGTFVGQGSTNGLFNALAYYNLNNANGGTPGFDGFYANQTGINNLMVLEIPFEFTVRLKKVDLRAFGDYAQNLEGAQRATAAYNASHSTYFTANYGTAIYQISSPQRDDKHAYQIGLAISSSDGLGIVNGATARRHAWEVRSYWQHVEQYSLDPNLIDTDFFEGVENLEGFYVAIAYGFTDNFIGTFRYGRASRINKKLGTGGSGQDIPQMNPINQFDLFQVDLTYKF